MCQRVAYFKLSSFLPINRETQPSAALSLRRTVPPALALSLTRARSQSADRTGTQPLLLPEEPLETDEKGNLIGVL